MVSSRGSREYVDCELFLAGRDQAWLSVAGRDYSGRPVLDAALERRLLEVDLEPARYGTSLFQALLPAGDDLLTGYRESLALARHEGKRPSRASSMLWHSATRPMATWPRLTRALRITTGS